MNYDEQSEQQFFTLITVQSVKECLQDQSINEQKLSKFVNLINEKYKDNVQKITYEIIEAYSSPTQLQELQNSRKQIEKGKVSQNLVKNIENSIVDLKKILNDFKTNFEQSKTMQIPQIQFQQSQKHIREHKKEDIIEIKRKIEELRIQIDKNKKDFNEIINNTLLKCIQHHCVVQTKELNRQNNMVENVKKHLLGFYKFQTSAFNKINYIAHKMAMVQFGSSLLSSQQDDTLRLRQQLKATQMQLLQSNLDTTRRIADITIQPELLKQPGISNILTKCEQLQRQLYSVEVKVSKIQPSLIAKYTQIFNGFYVEQQLYIQNFAKVTTKSIQTLSDRVLIVSNQFQDFLYDRVYHKRLNMQIFQNEKVRLLVKAAFLGKNNYIQRIQQSLISLDDKVTRQQQHFREVQLQVIKDRKKIVYDVCAQIIGYFGKKFTETQKLVVIKHKQLMDRLNTVQEILDKYKSLRQDYELELQKIPNLQLQKSTLSQTPNDSPKQYEHESIKHSMKLIDQLAQSLIDLHAYHIQRIQNALQLISIKKLDICNVQIFDLNQALDAQTPVSNNIQQRLSNHVMPSPNQYTNRDNKLQLDQNDDDMNKKYPLQQSKTQGSKNDKQQPLDESREISLDDLDNTVIIQKSEKDQQQSPVKSKKPIDASQNIQQSLKNSKLQQSVQLDVFSDDEKDIEQTEEEESVELCNELEQFIKDNSSLVQSKYVITPQMLHTHRISVLREFIKKQILNKKVVQWLDNLYTQIGQLFDGEQCQILASQLKVPYGEISQYKRAFKIYLIKIWDKSLEKQFLDASIRIAKAVTKMPKSVSSYNRQQIGVLMQKFFETDDPFETHISTVVIAFVLFLHLYDYEPQTSPPLAPGKTLVQPRMCSSITDVEQLAQQAALKK